MKPSCKLRALRFFSILAFQLFSIFPLAAILDLNNNGISDLWEKQHNNGNLFTISFLPTADPDQDGWDNATEAVAGTDPFEPNPPEGIVDLQLIPSANQGAYYLTWPTIIGKRYRLQASYDLDSWLTMGEPIVGIADAHSLGINVEQPDFTIPPKIFWRVLVNDLDDDGDTLTNTEEHQLGTNPNSIDSDGDTLTDQAEVLAATNPLLKDTDLDGINDNLDATPLLNNAIANPDGANLPASISQDLRGFWDFESSTLASGYYQIPDLSGGNRHAQSYSGSFNNFGMPSKCGRIGPGYITIPSTTVKSTSAVPIPSYTLTCFFKMKKNFIQDNNGIFRSIFCLYDINPPGPAPDYAPTGQGIGLFVRKHPTTGAEEWHLGGYKQTYFWNEYPKVNGSPKTEFNGHRIIRPAGSTDNEKWHHLAVTKSSVSNGQKLYIDGNLIFQGNLLDYNVNHDADTYFTFGLLHPNHTGGSNLIDCFIDRLRIHKKLLDQSEIHALSRQDIDNDGLWDITEFATAQKNYVTSLQSHPTVGTPLPGTNSQFIRSPYYYENPDTDSDLDGLTDIEEQTRGTDLTKPDADGDGLLDGWEVQYGLNPLVAGNDATNDPDGDGLTNLQEYLNNTNPNHPNTDGSGGTDSQEVGAGSDPADATNDTAPPPGEMENMPIVINGDYTKWEVVFTGLGPDDKRVRRFRMDNYNTAKSMTFPIRKGNSYEMTMIYQSTIPGQDVPWYCWEAKIDGKTDQGWLFENHWFIDNSSQLLAQHTHSQGVNKVGGKKVEIKPIALEITDKLTKDDAVPYVANSDASPPDNKELCLRALVLEHEGAVIEGATILIDVPGLTNATQRQALRWKIIKKSDDSVISEGVLGEEAVTGVLSLGGDSSVADEILFEIQIGADAAPYAAIAKVPVRVCRDRLNWWLEPFDADMIWNTAKPEPRKDTTDYMFKQIPGTEPNTTVTVPDPDNPFHRADAYKRESLQSVYAYLKSTTAIGKTPKTSFLKPTITCFGQFHEALKSANGNNALVDLNSLAEIEMSSVLDFSSFTIKYNALRSLQAQQTTLPLDSQPTLRALQFPERVQWATAATTAINNPNLTRGRLLALWQKEGSLRLNTQSSTVTNFNADLAATQMGANPPASLDDAKVCYIYNATYMCLGSDFLILTYRLNGVGDNQADLRDYAAALTHIKTKADQIGGVGSGDKLFNALTATSTAAGYNIAVDAPVLYEELLRLVGLFYLGGWQPEGPDMSYMVYNMGTASFNQMKGSLASSVYPERSRLGLVNWAIHYEIRDKEYDKPRDHAQKFHAYRIAFENKYP